MGVVIEQHQQFQFALGGAAADDRGGEVAGAAEQYPIGLLQGDDRPADIRQHLPEPHPVGIEPPPARLFVGAVKRRPVGDTAQFAVEPGEAPALAAEPADILVRVAPTGEFPIEDAGQPPP